MHRIMNATKPIKCKSDRWMHLPRSPSMALTLSSSLAMIFLPCLSACSSTSSRRPANSRLWKILRRSEIHFRTVGHSLWHFLFCAAAFFTHPQGPPCANFKCNTSFVFVGKKMKFNGELFGGDFKVQFHLASPTRKTFRRREARELCRPLSPI